MPDRSLSNPPARFLPGQAFDIDYVNWRGERALRRIEPLSLRHGSTEWHPLPQWLLLARDADRPEPREFALAGGTTDSELDLVFLPDVELHIEEHLVMPLRLRFGGPQGWLLLVTGTSVASMTEIRLTPRPS